MTDDEIRKIWDEHTVPVFGKTGINPIVFARAVLAAQPAPTGKSPCARHCEAAAFEIEIRRLRGLLAAQPAPVAQWQPIETCPETGFFLVEEDTAIRTMWRYKGAWSSPAIAGIVGPWGDFINGEDNLRRILPDGYKLEIHELCMQPAHWMPLPAALGATK